MGIDMKSNVKSKIVKTIIYIYLSLLAVVYLLPLVWMLFISLKNDKEIFTSPYGFPEKFMWENYTFAWTAGQLGTATLNSVSVCVTT